MRTCCVYHRAAVRPRVSGVSRIVRSNDHRNASVIRKIRPESCIIFPLEIVLDFRLQILSKEAGRLNSSHINVQLAHRNVMFQSKWRGSVKASVNRLFVSQNDLPVCTYICAYELSVLSTKKQPNARKNTNVLRLQNVSFVYKHSGKAGTVAVSLDLDVGQIQIFAKQIRVWSQRRIAVCIPNSRAGLPHILAIHTNLVLANH